jgi:hypothetical protein
MHRFMEAVDYNLTRPVSLLSKFVISIVHFSSRLFFFSDMDEFSFGCKLSNF